MRKSTGRLSDRERFIELGAQLQRLLPSLWGVLSDEGEFISLRLKAKPDGTTLAVLKRYGPDGGPLVCFGSGYGVAGCLMAVDASVQGGNWKPDKPWPGAAK